MTDAMPNPRAGYEHGMSFDNLCVPAPLCRPARAALLASERAQLADAVPPDAHRRLRALHRGYLG